MGGRDQEMTFGIGKIRLFSALYKASADERTIVQAVSTGSEQSPDGPNARLQSSTLHTFHRMLWLSKQYGSSGKNWRGHVT